VGVPSLVVWFHPLRVVDCLAAGIVRRCLVLDCLAVAHLLRAGCLGRLEGILSSGINNK
jgi:hypothetical protein